MAASALVLHASSGAMGDASGGALDLCVQESLGAMLAAFDPCFSHEPCQAPRAIGLTLTPKTEATPDCFEGLMAAWNKLI